LLDPNLISLLFLAGLAGIGFEIFHPGIVLPGALGAVCLLMALFGLAILPIEWTGLGLVLLGAALLLIDAHVVSHGALTISGLVAMGFGFATLFHDSSGTYQTSVPLVVALTVVIGGAWALGIRKAVQAKRQPVQVGPQEIVGMRGIVRRDGRVAVHGELWRAQADEPLREGEPVQVDALDGLTLRVHRIAQMETSQ
jgi:membrane-bound serine protease (ClpP class)